MMQSELWMLTPLVLFITLKIPLTDADNKSQRKLNDKNDNYIITHYGVEYYTPVIDTETPIHNSGYYTAEVIPVDVNTGEELKTIKNLFVPMYSGYSIGVSGVPEYQKIISSKESEVTNKQAFRLTTESENTATLDDIIKKEEAKSKFSKKFKKKYISPKETVNSLNYSNVKAKNDDTDNVAGFYESSPEQKINQKRHTFGASDDISRLFFNNYYKPLIRKQNLGYYYY